MGATFCFGNQLLSDLGVVGMFSRTHRIRSQPSKADFVPQVEHEEGQAIYSAQGQHVFLGERPNQSQGRVDDGKSLLTSQIARAPYVNLLVMEPSGIVAPFRVRAKTGPEHSDAMMHHQQGRSKESKEQNPSPVNVYGHGHVYVRFQRPGLHWRNMGAPTVIFIFVFFFFMFFFYDSSPVSR